MPADLNINNITFAYMAISNNTENCKNCKIRCKAFSCLTKSEIQIVNQNRFEALYKQGEIIVKQGSPASSAILVHSGLVKIYMEGVGGRNLIACIAGKGSLIMGPGAISDLRHTFSASSLTEADVCFIKFDVIRSLFESNTLFAETLIKEVCAGSLRAYSSLISLTQKKMPGRLAESLLYLSDEVFASDEFDLVLSRQELGEMSNMAKESVIRILRGFEESGIIGLSGPELKILDKRKLMLISQKG